MGLELEWMCKGDTRTLGALPEMKQNHPVAL